VISARFNNTHTVHDTNSDDCGESFCVVNVGTQKAETLKLKCTNFGEIKWDEHFSIEYFDKREKESFFQLEVYTNGQLKGFYKQNISEIVGDKVSWDKTKIREAPLVSKTGKEMGEITFRIRREEKCYGTVKISIKDCELNYNTDQILSAKAVANLSTISHETGISEGKLDNNVKLFSFKKSEPMEFYINKNNNVFDFFIEVWNCNPTIVTSDHNEHQHEEKQERTDKKPISGHLMGQARLPVFDIKHNSRFQLPVITQTPDHRLIGTIKVNTEFIENKTEKEIQKKKKTKNHPTNEDHPDSKKVQDSDVKHQGTDIKKDDTKTKDIDTK
jgi:hypothetical protein